MGLGRQSRITRLRLFDASRQSERTRARLATGPTWKRCVLPLSRQAADGVVAHPR
jgi:hypothetical protein